MHVSGLVGIIKIITVGDDKFYRTLGVVNNCTVLIKTSDCRALGLRIIVQVVCVVKVSIIIIVQVVCVVMELE